MKEEQPGQAKSKPKPKASSKVRREYRLEPGSKAQEEEGSGRTVQKTGICLLRFHNQSMPFICQKNNYYDQVMGFPSI